MRRCRLSSPAAWVLLPLAAGGWLAAARLAAQAPAAPRAVSQAAAPAPPAAAPAPPAAAPASPGAAPPPPAAGATSPPPLANADFEGSTAANGVPSGWRFPSAAGSHLYSAVVDSAVVHGGHGSVRIQSLQPALPAEAAGILLQGLPADAWRGRRLRLSGWLRGHDIAASGFGGLWMRIDGPGQAVLAFDNMSDRGIKGTKDWQEYEVVLDVPINAAGIALGALLQGQGTLWADDLKLETVSSLVPTTSCGCDIGGH
jgi:hypothetical protein